jgi:hydrogenase expression/formation protein HypE
LPPCEEDQVEAIFRDVHEAAAQYGIALVGGHTEITHGLDRPVIVTTMMGLADRLVTAADAQAGDALILTKGIAIEGAAVMAREIGAGQSRDAGSSAAAEVAPEVLRRAAGYLEEPGISVVAEARVAVRHGARALHDPTEGGLITGIWEMAEASGLGVEVDCDRVPILPEAAALCSANGLDVFRTLASGALLIACPVEQSATLLAALREEGISATTIGRFVRGSRTLRRADEVVPLEPSAQDELTKLFA